MVTSMWKNKFNYLLKVSEDVEFERYKSQLKVYSLTKVKKELVEINQSVQEIESYLSDKV